MKKLIFFIVLVIATSALIAQETSLSDAGRIILNSVVMDKEIKLPVEAKGYLQSKLTQIATENGMGGNSITPRFVIAAKINVLTKNIVAGPPQMLTLNMEINFFIGNAADNKVFATTAQTVKGVGSNETKALIAAIQNINSENTQFSALAETGKNKIVEYYSSQCDFIIKKAKTLSLQQQYEEAIYELMQVPEVCKVCFDKCMDAVKPVYQKMIDRNCTLKLNEAKAKWNASPDSKGADEAGSFLASIDPDAACYKDATSFAETIRKQIEVNEKRNWDFKMKIYYDIINIEQQRISAAREVAIAYYKNLPNTIIYNRILW